MTTPREAGARWESAKRVGIDIGATKWLLVGTLGTAVREIATGSVQADPVATMAEIATHLRAEQRPLSGCAFAGGLDQAGAVSVWPNRPEWNGFGLAAALQQVCGRPVPIDDDGVCSGWGELTAGVGIGLRDFLCLTLGTGIGGAIFLDGKVRKPRGAAARTFGHIRVAVSESCACGNQGCLQASYRAGLASGESQWMKHFVELAADLALLVDLEAVVLTGGMLEHRPDIADSLRRGLVAQLSQSRCRVALAQRPSLSAALGAASLGKAVD